MKTNFLPQLQRDGEADEKIDGCCTNCQSLTSALTRLQEEVKEKDENLQTMKNAILKTGDWVHSIKFEGEPPLPCEVTISSLQSQLIEKDNEIAELNAEIQRHTVEAKDKDRQVVESKIKLVKDLVVVESLVDKKLSEKDENIEINKSAIRRLDNHLLTAEKLLIEKDNEIAELKEKVYYNEIEIPVLNTRIKELEEKGKFYLTCEYEVQKEKMRAMEILVDEYLFEQCVNTVIANLQNAKLRIKELEASLVIEINHVKDLDKIIYSQEAENEKMKAAIKTVMEFEDWVDMHDVRHSFKESLPNL